MTRLPAELLRLDRLIRANAIHSMTGETYQSVGLRGPEIVAISTSLWIVPAASPSSRPWLGTRPTISRPGRGS